MEVSIKPEEVVIQERPEITLSTKDKIYDSIDRLKEKVDELKMEGKKIGYITGTFDVLHLGHAGIINEAKQNCDVLVVGIANDDSTIATKGTEFFTQKQRSMMLSSLQQIDLVFNMQNPNAEATSEEAKKYLDYVAIKVNPDVIVASSATDANFETKKKQAQMLDIKFVDYKVPAFASSTTVRDWVETTF